MPFTNATLTTGTAANIYASTGNSIISTMYLCNVTGTDVLVNIHAVQSGGSPADTNLIYKDLLIAPSDTYVMDVEKLLLGDNDTIRGNSNVASSVTATTSYTGA